MGISLQRATPEDREAVQAFNARLRAAGVRDFKLPESPVSTWLPPGGDYPLFEDLWLAREGPCVRGGYLLKHQPFRVDGRMQPVGYLYSPVSEALIAPQYGAVGLQLLLHAQRQQPLLYCLGMGGLDQPLPRLLRAARWSLAPVPFLFYPCRPAALCRNLTLLRRTAARAALADALAATGLGALALRLGQAMRRQTPPARVEAQQVPRFEAWVDLIWERAAPDYRFIAERTLPALARLYPEAHPRQIKLRCRRAGETAGWAVVLDTAMRGSRHFGDLRVGSVVDVLALPGEEAAVAWAATQFLAARGVELMVTNQAQAGWVGAFQRAGWLNGPSNFIFAAAPRLAALLQPWPGAVSAAHLTRGDGEGPTHL